MSKVVEVTDQNFEEEVLRSDLPTEVDFWAPWCSACVRISSIYDELSEEYENFKFCRMNVAESPQIAVKYQIMSIPIQMFFVDGEKVDEIVGTGSVDSVRTKIKGILKSRVYSQRLPN